MKVSGEELPPRGTTTCPWGRDCPWDWPRTVPFRTRVRWARDAVWYALTGLPPKEPLVVRAALTREDIARAGVFTDAKIEELARLIDTYEHELHLFRLGGKDPSAQRDS